MRRRRELAMNQQSKISNQQGFDNQRPPESKMIYLGFWALCGRRSRTSTSEATIFPFTSE